MISPWCTRTPVFQGLFGCYTPPMPKPYVHNDAWSQRAAKEGYRARSVYKLQELNELCGILKPGMKVLDIGAAPGSWLQYTATIVGERGRVLGIDLSPIKAIGPNVHTAVCDINDQPLLETLLHKHDMMHPDVILSDMAPNTSGIKDVDQWRSVELCRRVLAVSDRILAPGGTMVLKIFRGKSFDAFFAELKQSFGKVRVQSVEASRDRSREIYLVCRGHRVHTRESH